MALDLQLGVGTATGIGEYASGAAAALRARGIEVVPLHAPRLDPWRFDRRVIWDQALLPLAALRARADLVHFASGTMPLLRLRSPSVVTVHDVAWLRVQGHVRPYARWYFGAFALARYRTATRIVVDSAFSRDELLALGGFDPGRVDVVAPGVASDIAAVERRPAAEPYVLAVGTIERRKNLEVAIRALAGSRTPLVAVGPPTPYRERCAELARACGTTLVFRGYVGRAELLALYAGAALAIVPSRYEGFGYGAAQALCAGVPLLAAETSSLPEVVGDDAPLLPPDDAGAWRDAIARILAGPAAAERHAAEVRDAARARLGWAASGADLERAYRKALGTGGPQ